MKEERMDNVDPVRADAVEGRLDDQPFPRWKRPRITKKRYAWAWNLARLAGWDALKAEDPVMYEFVRYGRLVPPEGAVPPQYRQWQRSAAAPPPPPSEDRK